MMALACPAFARNKVFTSDITHFWEAYDSVKTVSDSALQRDIIQRLYVDRGTPGLKAFMKARNYSAEGWVILIRTLPKFWESVRPQTLGIAARAGEIETSIQKLKQLYPGLRPASMYFTIGGLRSGGTVQDSMVLIGAEIAAGSPETDVSEFPNKWLAGVFRAQNPDNLVALNIHEYIHTQQTGGSTILLGQCIGEGACDFIAELVIGKPWQKDYMIYGRRHESELKEKFKAEMLGEDMSNWLYNGSNAKDMADLGYYMGYVICKSYYTHAGNKKKAIREIITLDLSNDTAVKQFLERSRYY